jgi:hypothetical protein
MSVVDNRPENMNFLSPLNFKFQIKRTQSLNFFVQKVNLPGLSLPNIDENTPLIRIPYSGDHLLFDELVVTFKVDENLINYMEIHNWLRGLGKPSYEEYKNLKSKSTYTGESLNSDISLSILTSYKNPNYEVIFTDAFPISLSGIEFTTTAEDISYLEATATFKYLTYTIKKTS